MTALPCASHSLIRGAASARSPAKSSAHAAELAAQETGYQLAVDGRIETREVHILALDAPVGKKTAQHADLGRFTGPVQSFEYYEHRLIPDYLSFYPSISRPARYPRSIRTARSTPSASASASASVL